MSHQHPREAAFKHVRENVQSHFYNGSKPDGIFGASSEVGNQNIPEVKPVHTKEVPEGVKPQEALSLFKAEVHEEGFDPKYFIALGHIALDSADKNTAVDVYKTAFENDAIKDSLVKEFGRSFSLMEKALPLLPADQQVGAVLNVAQQPFARFQTLALAGVLADTIKKHPENRVELLKEMFILHRFSTPCVGPEKSAGELLYDLRNFGTREEQLAMRQDMAKAFADVRKRKGYGNDEIVNQQENLTKYKFGPFYNPTRSILKNGSGR